MVFVKNDVLNYKNIRDIILYRWLLAALSRPGRYFFKKNVCLGAEGGRTPPLPAGIT
jgi:hypothetical protein